ncbi:hypothetical protein [Luteimonas viscosa]|uniref:hypothetical protein n=1 Tax=Luteimonas viscosa TaxID=1132694 RepID=UPI0021CC9311|nr:hypothetical protein [Luteimonas viscosa]
MKKTLRNLSLVPLALALSACVYVGDSDGDGNAAAQADAAAEGFEPAPQAAAADAGSASEPADAFLAALATHCGQAFAGRIVANAPEPPEPDAFEGQRLVMHVRGCDEPARELRVPFHVGDDHSRTWVLTRTGSGLRLKHDHRHQDGSDDAVTMYGGDTASAGTAVRQEFPVDAESVAMFEREGLEASVTNTWAMEIEPGERFAYELTRPGGREFKVEFDLATPVDLPPPPWGSGDPVASSPGD